MSTTNLNSTGFNTIAHIVPLVMMVTFFCMAWLWPDYFEAKIVLRESLEGAGLAENLTVALLIPGIISGFYVLVRYRHLLPDFRVIGWLLMWTLACVYFAGEEMSWGQWYFQWETPDAFKGINDQQETNLHNISSWMDQKPRALVELWIFIGGLILPLVQWIRGRPLYAVDQWKYWIQVPMLCFSAALFFATVRFAKWNDQVLIQRYGDPELREMAIALFLTLYLCSFLVRLKKLAAHEKTQ